MNSLYENSIENTEKTTEVYYDKYRISQVR